MNYWLVKQEPSKYPWEQFLKDKETYWDGVRNYQARNNLKLMKKGATWELFIPSKLAYGARGTRGQIGPNSTLIFTIHLIDIEKSKESNASNSESKLNFNQQRNS